MNGKELPHASFMKYTSHAIQKDLRINHPEILDEYKVDLDTRQYQFWKRDSLPILLYTPKVIFEKLEYIHNNTVKGKWFLSDIPEGYPYSSARYYMTGETDFGFLTHIGERI
jgi:putative transposase